MPVAFGGFKGATTRSHARRDHTRPSDAEKGFRTNEEETLTTPFVNSSHQGLTERHFIRK